MTTQETTIEETQKLEAVIQQSGLQVNETDEVKSNYLPFLERLHQIKEQSVKINKETPTDIDEKIARELRLKTVKIRTDAEDVKDSRKKIHLLKGNLEQAAYNLIKADCQLIEEAFTQVEKVREIAEKKRKAELKTERLAILLPYELVISTQFIDLENMGDDDFQKLLDGAKLSLDTKIAAEKKAEEERIAAIEAERIRQEEIRLENERLKKEAEEKEKAKIEFAKNKKSEAIIFLTQLGFESDEHGMSAKNYKHFIGLNIYSQFENENEFESFKENVLKTKQLEDERAKAEAEKKAAELKAKKEREEVEAKLKAEQEKARKEKEKADAERAKLEAELKAKKDAEEAEKRRIESEEKARIEAEKKAAKAPKKQKLTKWVDGFVMGAPTGMNEDETVIEILEKFEGFKKWATAKVDSL